ncbi:hypothetical protein K402DRAFT_61640 [Aulographum hederae CBS 113979]|uniref:Uncharacterized protein n=1 Tax=Aulographum hederae CBS 113979 TaxID=1176131 RepID=A0A6G1H1H4_9PEZI|nr:hypothetical protein K402DRAFT_61640 [Aulographum hederae CBS 113979]
MQIVRTVVRQSQEPQPRGQSVDGPHNRLLKARSRSSRLTSSGSVYDGEQTHVRSLASNNSRVQPINFEESPEPSNPRHRDHLREDSDQPDDSAEVTYEEVLSHANPPHGPSEDVNDFPKTEQTRTELSSEEPDNAPRQWHAASDVQRSVLPFTTPLQAAFAASAAGTSIAKLEFVESSPTNQLIAEMSATKPSNALSCSNRAVPANSASELLRQFKPRRLRNATPPLEAAQQPSKQAKRPRPQTPRSSSTRTIDSFEGFKRQKLSNKSQEKVPQEQPLGDASKVAGPVSTHTHVGSMTASSGYTVPEAAGPSAVPPARIPLTSNCGGPANAAPVCAVPSNTLPTPSNSRPTSAAPPLVAPPLVAPPPTLLNQTPNDPLQNLDNTLSTISIYVPLQQHHHSLRRPKRLRHFQAILCKDRTPDLSNPAIRQRRGCRWVRRRRR